MPKPTKQSICKRTRSKSTKQTSLLDFDNVPKKQKRAASTSTTKVAPEAGTTTKSLTASRGMTKHRSTSTTSTTNTTTKEDNKTTRLKATSSKKRRRTAFKQSNNSSKTNPGDTTSSSTLTNANGAHDTVVPTDNVGASSRTTLAAQETVAVAIATKSSSLIVNNSNNHNPAVPIYKPRRHSPHPNSNSSEPPFSSSTNNADSCPFMAGESPATRNARRMYEGTKGDKEVGSSKKSKKKKRDTVCYDVVKADDCPPSKPVRNRCKTIKSQPPRTAEETVESTTMAQQGEEQGGSPKEIDGTLHTNTIEEKQKAITPSPDPLARKEAQEKNHAANNNNNNNLELSSDNDVDTHTSANGGEEENDSTNLDLTSSTPNKRSTGNMVVEKKEGEESTKMAKKVNHRSITMDHYGDVQLLEPPSQPQPQQVQLMSMSQRMMQDVDVAYHQPWKEPYQAAGTFTTNNATTSTVATVPSGVVDIDMLPHHCCPYSSQSHAGYSWITSKRRCGCMLDTDHCSSESLTESYLGVYGVERYGAGLLVEQQQQQQQAGGGSSAQGLDAKGLKGDWRTEERWLDGVREEREMLMKNDSFAQAAGNSNNKQGSAKNQEEVVGCLDEKLENVTNLADIFKQSCKKKSPKEEQEDNNDNNDNDKTSSRTPSPTSSLSDISSASQLRLQSLPTSISTHIDYISRQPQITVEMRGILMDWLVEVAEEYKLSTETFMTAVTLVDRSLACSYGEIDELGVVGTSSSGKKGRKDKGSSGIVGGDMVVQKDRLQLVGCACTLIASKLHEITPPSPDDFVYISDKTYTRREVLDMEARVCRALKFNLNFCTPVQYVDRFLRASYVTSEGNVASAGVGSGRQGMSMAVMASCANNPRNVLMNKLVHYLLDLAVLEYKLVAKKPSLVCAAAVYLARATLGVCDPASDPMSLGRYWSKTLEYYTGYDQWDLEESVRLLYRLQDNAEESNLSCVFKKHKGVKTKRVAMKTVVNEEELGFL